MNTQTKTNVWAVSFASSGAYAVKTYVAAESAADAIYWAMRVRPDETTPITRVEIAVADVWVAVERG